MRAKLAVLRMVAAVLRDDPANKVSVRLATLARLAGDAVPPVPTAILCQADDNVQVREEPATGWPVLLVLEDQGGADVDPDNQISFRDAKVRVFVALVDAPAKQADGYRGAQYTMQAVVDGLQHGLLDDAVLNTAGRLGAVQILQATRLTAGTPADALPLGTITAAVRYEFDVRDINP